MPYASPTSADVAAILPTRTKDRAGVYAEDFPETGNTTRAKVELMIGVAEGLVLPGLGSLSAADLSEGCRAGVWAGAKSLVTVAAALFVEAGFYPEQQGQGDQTSTAILQDLLNGDVYDRVAKAAAACRGETGGGDDDAGGADAPADSSFAFPEDRGGMIGHQSRWRRLAYLADQVGWDECEGVYRRGR